MPAREASAGELRVRLEECGQGHLLRFHDTLSERERRALLEQIAALDLASIPELVARYVKGKPGLEVDTASLEPAPYYPRDPADRNRAWDRARFRKLGEELIGAGKVAAFTVAGGQGTRLGHDGPKGTFPGGPVTGKPLFACLADWILAAQRRWLPSGRSIPWYVMTSPINHEATVSFFKANRFFGMAERDVMFFAQGVMPSFDMASGRILLDQPGVVATNPDGHGGSLRALHQSGALDDMSERGIEHISYVQIDNPLARVIDPVFIGLHAHAEDSSGEMSSKMVEKTNAEERVGVFARSGGRTLVVEYSDLPRELAGQRGPDGRLRFKAGSIAVHVLGTGFVRRLNEGGAGGESFALPYHRAEKKVPYIDLESGKRVEPAAANAVKLETFVFDAIPLCRASIVMETDRVEEFAPIKNADGADSPATCAALQTERAARWLAAAGVAVPRRADGAPDCTIEISPLTAMYAEDLPRSKLPARIERGARLAL